MTRPLMTAVCLIAAIITAHAQDADTRIGTMMGENRWFDLAQELDDTPTDSVTPLLHDMATAMTHHYFNRPDSACAALGRLLAGNQDALGPTNTLSLATLMGIDLARAGHYGEAAGLIRSLNDQLTAQGADSTVTAAYTTMARQYSTLADNGPVCRPLHPAATYRIPMTEYDTMHTATGKASGAHFITMDGHINGHSATLVFDTGAGVNTITSRQADEYGLRRLETTIPMQGIGLQQGRYAMADTLRIGGMAWADVPFLIVDISTGNATADSIGALLPPVIGMPLMLSMQEVQMDFANRQFVIPATPTPNPLPASNLLRTDSDNLHLRATDAEGHPLILHFDTGGYETVLSRQWYERHKAAVDATCTPDSLRTAGVGGVSITRSYFMPQMTLDIGGHTATLDTVSIDTGIDLHTGNEKGPHPITDGTDGMAGLDLMEQFDTVILNLKDMYLCPVTRQR